MRNITEWTTQLQPYSKSIIQLVPFGSCSGSLLSAGSFPILPKRLSEPLTQGIAQREEGTLASGRPSGGRLSLEVQLVPTTHVCSRRGF